jgi:uncharacterized protein YcbK (DUF882 family)
MSLHSVREGIKTYANTICASTVIVIGLIIPTASHAERDTYSAAVSTSGERSAGARASSPSKSSARASRSSSRASASRNRQPVRQAESRPRRSKGVQVASLGGTRSDARPSRSLSGGGGRVNWVADSGCLNGTLRGVVSHVASNFGAVTVSSTCRSRGHNARVGGAPKSHHLSGDAVDFRVSGNVSGAMSYLSGRSGGFKHYGGGLFHVDTGPTRRF